MEEKQPYVLYYTGAVDSVNRVLCFDNKGSNDVRELAYLSKELAYPADTIQVYFQRLYADQPDGIVYTYPYVRPVDPYYLLEENPTAGQEVKWLRGKGNIPDRYLRIEEVGENGEVYITRSGTPNREILSATESGVAATWCKLYFALEGEQNYVPIPWRCIPLTDISYNP